MSWHSARWSRCVPETTYRLQNNYLQASSRQWLDFHMVTYRNWIIWDDNNRPPSCTAVYRRWPGRPSCSPTTTLSAYNSIEPMPHRAHRANLTFNESCRLSFLVWLSFLFPVPIGVYVIWLVVSDEYKYRRKIRKTRKRWAKEQAELGRRHRQASVAYEKFPWVVSIPKWLFGGNSNALITADIIYGASCPN